MATRRRSKGQRSSTSGGMGARTRLGPVRTSRTPPREETDATAADATIAEPTVTADDAVLAASNAKRALSPDMPRVAWLRTQLMQLEANRRDRVVRVLQLTLIAIIFIAFVLQNAQPVNVHFLLFSLNIRLIWVIFGCGVLGGVAGFLIGRPDRNLRSLFPRKPQKVKKPAGPARA